MGKAVISVILVLAVLAQPALAGRSGPSSRTARESKLAEGQKSKTTNSESARRCKKYFALVGAVISVPC